MKINISRYNDGCSASVEDNDDNSFHVHIHRSHRNAKRICLDTAKTLRIAAARFELLAAADEPFKCATQDRINRAKITLPK